MTLDISLAAIENDLRMAERGGQVADLAMARAQVRATLLASGHRPGVAMPDPGSMVERSGADIQVAQGIDVDVYTVPKSSPWDDRVTAAAMLLAVPPDVLQSLFARGGFEVPGGDPLAAPTEEDARAGEPEEEPPVEEDDVDADFFAEAKKARRKK